MRQTLLSQRVCGYLSSSRFCLSWSTDYLQGTHRSWYTEAPRTLEILPAHILSSSRARVKLLQTFDIPPAQRDLKHKQTIRSSEAIWMRVCAPWGTHSSTCSHL